MMCGVAGYQIKTKDGWRFLKISFPWIVLTQCSLKGLVVWNMISVHLGLKGDHEFLLLGSTHQSKDILRCKLDWRKKGAEREKKESESSCNPWELNPLTPKIS